jgi:hypothetical protein
MSLVELLRKGFGYVLMAMGASSSDALKKKPGTGSSAKNGPPQPPKTSA